MVAQPGSAKLLTLADILTSQTIIDVRQVMILTKAMARLLKIVHMDGLMMTDLNASSVNIHDWEQVCLYFPRLWVAYSTNKQ